MQLAGLVLVTAPTPSMSALDAIYQRRATRAYTADRIDEATVRELLRAATRAPTAMHLEPWSFAVIQDRALLTRISDRAKSAATSAAEHRELAREETGVRALLSSPDFDIFYGATTLIVICAKPGPFSSADCWLAAENLMLAATALGLATCPIGFALLALTDPGLRTELSIPNDVTPVAPIIVGVPLRSPAPTSRKEPEILSWIVRK